MVVFPIYAAGKWIEAGAELLVQDKFSETVIAKTFLANETVLNTCVAAANAVKQEFSQMPSHQKYEQLLYIAESMRAEREYLAELLCAESAKPMRYALTEIDRAAQTFIIAAEEAKRLPKEYMSLDWTAAGNGKEGLVKYKSIGVVAGISPFNFPMNLAVHKLAPAMAAGCPIILKPASATPLSTLALAKIIDKTTFPKGSVSILPMNRATGELLVEHTNVNYLSFTGSPDVGWDLKAKSGKKKVTLELGGNAAVIITPHVKLDSIINQCIVGAFSYSGQICIHAQRFIVHASIFDAFVQQMKKEAMKLTYGKPQDEKTDVSVMIDEANANRVEQWVQQAIEAGARLICGGQRNGRFVSPTILTHVPSNQPVYAEEVFGPVICIESYDSDIFNAIHKVNNSRFGLQASVFTDSITELNACFEQLEVGGVIHNAISTTRFDHMPYGGIKDSGLGREGVKYAILDLLEPRILVTSK